MASRVLSLRVPEELAEWAEEYAQARGVAKQELLVLALESFRVNCERGVPELRRMVAEQSSVYTGAGVGVCPARDEGLGHVWGSGATRPCVFCGLLGRARRSTAGEIVEPGFFDRATEARVDLYAAIGAARAAKR